MFSLPSSRRLVIPAVSLLCMVLIYRLLTSSAPSTSRALIARRILSQVPRGTLMHGDNIAKHIIPGRPASLAHLSPPQHFYYSHNFSSQAPPDLTHLESLLSCATKPNPYTQHIRLPNLVFNVFSAPPGADSDGVDKFNPAIIPLPHWSANHYLLVSRVVTSGLHQESLLCEANICHPPNSNSSIDSVPCTPSNLLTLGLVGGLSCATAPIIINIPPTPAERCTGSWIPLPDIPGFHDPRIFWSGKNEPLIIVNSASRYGCVGLWLVDMRTLYKPLDRLLKGHDGLKQGPLMSYPRLTELTRNPRGERSAVEKNWMLFFPEGEEAFVHYDMVSHNPNATSSTSGRSFAKLIGNGYTSPSLAPPNETNCFTATLDPRGKAGHWHQGSNALRLILCTRTEAQNGACHEDEEGRNVHFAVMHRKFSNDWDLPLRYERWVVLWEGRAPWRVLARGRWPVLFANETASGWGARENWVDVEEEGRERRWGDESANLDKDGSMNGTGNPTSWRNESGSGAGSGSAGLFANATVGVHFSDTSHHSSAPKDNWAYFTYTPSIAWAWRPKSAEINRENRDGGAADGSYQHSLNVGYLDDDVIVGIGLEDTAQAFARVQARVLLQCLEVCPGVRD